MLGNASTAEKIAGLGVVFSLLANVYSVVNSNAQRQGAMTEWTKSERDSDAIVTKRLDVQRDMLQAHIAEANASRDSMRRDIESELRREIDLACRQPTRQP